MRKLAVLNTDEQITLFQLAQINEQILMNGLTKEILEELTVLQCELIDIIQKISK